MQPRSIKSIRSNRVYRPDLADHFILVHPIHMVGIVKFNTAKTMARVRPYEFDKDGDMRLGKSSWTKVWSSPKGPYIRRTDSRVPLHDFVKARANPYA